LVERGRDTKQERSATGAPRLEMLSTARTREEALDAAKPQLSRRQLQGTSRFPPSVFRDCLPAILTARALNKNLKFGPRLSLLQHPPLEESQRSTHTESISRCLLYACFGRKSPDIGSSDPQFQQRTAIEARPPHINIRLVPAPVCTPSSLVLEAYVEELAPGRRYESAGFRSMPPTV
jgi:hypothetical protein